MFRGFQSWGCPVVLRGGKNGIAPVASQWKHSQLGVGMQASDPWRPTAQAKASEHPLHRQTGFPRSQISKASFGACLISRNPTGPLDPICNRNLSSLKHSALSTGDVQQTRIMKRPSDLLAMPPSLREGTGECPGSAPPDFLHYPPNGGFLAPSKTAVSENAPVGGLAGQVC